MASTKESFDKKAFLNKIKKSDDTRIKATFTFDGNLFKRFQDECRKQKVAQSRVIEEFFKTFLGE